MTAGTPDVVPMTTQEMQEFALRCPFHRWLDMRVRSASADGIEIEVPWRDEIVSNPDRGTIHGGVLAAMLDATAAYAITTRLRRSVPTVDMRTDYHAIAESGQSLTVRGKVVHLGGTLGTADATVFDAKGALVASARATYFVKERKK